MKSLSFFLVKNVFEKLNNKGQTYNKAYSVGFIDSMKLKNPFLDTHVNNLPNKRFCFLC